MSKNSYLTVTDQFCGAGGSSQGARNAGLEVKMAMNHWKLAIETHNTNFPDTLHDCTDVSACDPRRYPSTNILITSPECTTHSPAGGNRHKRVKETMDLFDSGKIDPATERSRATMWDVCRFAEYHNYDIIIVENVVEARTQWVLFEVWLQAMHKLGYEHRCLYLNSMHFWPTPQSRDRMYVVFWKKGNKAPDLDYRPLANCPCCGKDIHALQNWKNPARKFGKYRSQYLYCCPADGTVVEPYYYAAFNAIDWSDLGTRIGDRKKELSPNTMNRIQWGLDKYGDDPMIIQTRQTSGLGTRVRSAVKDAIGTQVTATSHALAMPLVIKTEYGSNLKNAKSSTDPFLTQTTRQTSALVTPWIIEMNSTGEAKPADSPMSTITSGGINHAMMATPLIVENRGDRKCNSSQAPISTITTRDNHGILIPPLVVQNKGQSKSKPATASMPVQTSNINNGIVSHESWNSFIQYYYGNHQASKVTDPIGTVNTRDRSYVINYQKPKIEDCYYRMIKAPEVKISMAFDADYIVLGSGKDQVKQCGNAVTPPVQEWIIRQCANSLEV
jgi:DNA (cytosine-5)-methyltransferase 1